ncbi:MAG: dTDP-4-dehydrorhamnose 3,5-epimerase [Siphonobacter aquaeclarae]|nr:dTDP-4-dehydrorhamnose 3,5-epimerase [Siphonobacter aquaeclarae]
MEIRPGQLAGLIELFPRIFEDERGFFWESYNEKTFAEANLPTACQFVQDNHSWSKKGVLRGLHCQHQPHAQGKLVRCTQGSVLDVVVDIRPDSPTFGKHEKFLLTASRGNMLWVPGGFAHGFVALEEATFMYKCTNLYNKAAESGLLWNDPALGIDWGLSEYGIEAPVVSAKDQILPTWEEFKSLLGTLQNS